MSYNFTYQKNYPFDFLWSLKNVKAMFRPQAMQTQIVAGFFVLEMQLATSTQQPSSKNLVFTKFEKVPWTQKCEYILKER